MGGGISWINFVYKENFTYTALKAKKNNIYIRIFMFCIGVISMSFADFDGL